MNKQRSLYYRIIFYTAAWFNLLAGTMWVVDFEGMYSLMGGESIHESPLFYLILQSLSMIIILFGGVYFWVARNLGSQASRAFALVASIGKFLLAMLFYVYAARGDIPPALAGLTTGDLIYSILFMEYLLYQKKNIHKQLTV